VRAAFVAPVFYTGTSFERICLSVKACIENEKFDIDYIVLSELPNSLDPAEFDDKQFYRHQLKLLEFLVESKQNYDRILFVDFFNPGLDILKYELDRQGIEIKLYALLHGGSFMEADLLKEDWISMYEQAWASVYEKVYVPSYYAYHTLPEFLASKSSVYAWGLDAVTPELKPSGTKNIDVVFPHRMSSDKGIEELIAICALCPNAQFVVTSPSGIIPSAYKNISNVKNLSIITCRDTTAYYQTLGISKIVLSCAHQELYGYAIAEAVLSGAFPVLPNKQVYPEYYPANSLYDTQEQAAALITKMLQTADSQAIIPTDILAHSFAPLLKDFLGEKH